MSELAAETIIEAIEEVTGFGLGDLREPDKRHNTTATRRALAYLLVTEGGYSQGAVARLLERDHRTVAAMLVDVTTDYGPLLVLERALALLKTEGEALGMPSESAPTPVPTVHRSAAGFDSITRSDCNHP